jgi:hypothetical protein
MKISSLQIILRVTLKPSDISIIQAFSKAKLGVMSYSAIPNSKFLEPETLDLSFKSSSTEGT